jgi:membrane protein DedA with SNARE-associated domain
MTNSAPPRDEPLVSSKTRARVFGAIQRGVRTLGSRTALTIYAGVAVVGLIAYILHQIGGGDGFSLVTESEGSGAYFATFALIALDAVFPIFPGETTLNAASTLAAQGELSLILVIISGALGAIVGDSSLYWIARRNAHRVEGQVTKAKENPKVVAGLAFLGSSAPIMLVLGRYVPGVRFLVNATMGLQKHPYRHFLLWSSVGGILWATYTCLLAYVVGTALSDFPLASVVISGFITSAAIVVLFFVIRRRRRNLAAGASPQDS